MRTLFAGFPPRSAAFLVIAHIVPCGHDQRIRLSQLIGDQDRENHDHEKGQLRSRWIARKRATSSSIEGLNIIGGEPRVNSLSQC
jgi:hypothetical protein